VFVDGTFLRIALVNDPVASRLTLRRFDLLGNPVGPEQTIGTEGTGVALAQLSASDEGRAVLLTWSEQRGGSGTALRLARVDPNGRMLIGPTTVAGAGNAFYGMGAARRGDTVLVAFNPRANDAPGELRVLVVEADMLRLTGQTFTVGGLRFPHNIAVRATSAGFVVAYGAMGAGLTQVWTSLVSCGP
jgi:hypothetical protein